jgi:hypothetical protein
LAAKIGASTRHGATGSGICLPSQVSLDAPGAAALSWRLMSPKTEETAAPESRRWLIGIGISLFFGLFGVVMALLSYSQKAKDPASPAATATVAPQPAEAPGGPGRGKGPDHK